MWNEILVNATFGKLVLALVDEGYRLEISDQDGGGLYIYAAPDAGEVVKPCNYWVRLNPGNEDLVVDYSTNLASVLRPIFAFEDKFK